MVKQKYPVIPSWVTRKHEQAYRRCVVLPVKEIQAIEPKKRRTEFSEILEAIFLFAFIILLIFTLGG